MGELSETDKVVHKTAVAFLVVLVFLGLLGSLGLLVYSFLKWF